jgi:hypothetical protein
MSETPNRQESSEFTTPIPVLKEQAQVQAVVDKKAKAFSDKFLELISEIYTLSMEIASIEDAKLLEHPAIKQARKVIAKAKELRDVLGTK